MRVQLVKIAVILQIISHQLYSSKYDDSVYRGIQVPASFGDEETATNLFDRLAQSEITMLIYSGWTKWSTCPDSRSRGNVSCVTKSGLETKSYAMTYAKRERMCRKAKVVLEHNNFEPCHEDEQIQVETRECSPPPICPPPIDGGWSKWSDWSECSLKCQHPDSKRIRKIEKLSTGWQTRFRKCDSPAPEYGGRFCEGLNYERTICTNYSTPYCPIDGNWTPWSPLRNCEPIRSLDEDLPKYHEWNEKMDVLQTGQRCGPGILLQERRCSAPIPQHGGRLCKLNKPIQDGEFYGMIEVKKSHCYLVEGCEPSKYSSSNLEPAQDCVFRSTGESTVEVVWHRQAHGRYPSYFIITWWNQRTNEFDQRMIRVEDEPVDIWGEVYKETITGLTKDEEYTFEIITVKEKEETSVESRLEARDPNCRASVRVGKVDGDWSDWSKWDSCSAECVSTLGLQNRYRRCQFYEPYNKGSECNGKHEIQRTCFGEKFEC